MSCNPGDTADKISFQCIFPSREAPRRSEHVELTVEVGSRTFEWDVPDNGGAEFFLDSGTRQGLAAVQEMIGEMRMGRSMRARVLALGLDATFTLDGAFDVLRAAAELGH